MNKNTICALLLGFNLGCYSPVEEKLGERVIPVPKECAKTLSLVHNIRDTNWSLTCNSAEGKELFYERDNSDERWRKYEIVRQ